MKGVRDLFDSWALAGRAEGMERGHSPAARQAFERLSLGESERYLDIGCGNGYTVRWAARAAPSGLAVGIDISPQMVARARALSTDCPNARFVEGDFLTLDPPGAPYDAIFTMEVLYYLPDLHAGLSRARGLLRPGGRFACVVDYYAENLDSHSWPDDLGLPMILLDAAGWADAFRKAGLQVVSQERLQPGQDASASAGDGSLFTLGCL